MTKLDILIEEIELYRGKQLDKKYIYQELLEIRKELNEQFTITDVTSTLPNINSSTFRNYLEAKGYAETLNPLIYKKQGFEYDKEILHRHFLNEI